MGYRVVLQQGDIAAVCTHTDRERNIAERISTAIIVQPNQANNIITVHKQINLVAAQRINQTRINTSVITQAQRIGDRIGIFNVIVVAILEIIRTKVWREQTNKGLRVRTRRNIRIICRQNRNSDRIGIK